MRVRIGEPKSLNESFSKATVAPRGLGDVAPRHRYVPRAQHPPGEVLPPSQERPRGTRATARPSASGSDARDRSAGPPTHEGNRIRPRADRGASDPRRSSAPARTARRRRIRTTRERNVSSKRPRASRARGGPPTRRRRQAPRAVHHFIWTNERRRNGGHTGRRGRRGTSGAEELYSMISRVCFLVLPLARGAAGACCGAA